MYITKDAKIEALAMAAHQANRAYCIGLGDNSQPEWKDAPQWQKDSAIDGVRFALKGATPEQSHENWLREKERTGWKYGPVKDPDKKEHPCYVPYNELPEAQKVKDHIFIITVKGLGWILGFSITYNGVCKQ